MIKKLILLLVVITFCSINVKADTVGYWRFEGADIATDSSGNDQTLSCTALTSFDQMAIPSTGEGSAFPLIIPNTGEANNKMIDRTGGGYFYLRYNEVFRFTNSVFTIECFVNRQETSSSIYQMFASRWGSKGFSYTFGISGTGDLDPEYQLIIRLQEAGTGIMTNLYSGLTLNQEVDYYVAVAVDFANDTAKFYKKDLTNGGAMETSTVSHGLTALNWSHQATFRTHCNGYGYHFYGIIDELRFSDVALEESELLISALPSKGSVLIVR